MYLEIGDTTMQQHETSNAIVLEKAGYQPEYPNTYDMTNTLVSQCVLLSVGEVWGQIQ